MTWTYDYSCSCVRDGGTRLTPSEAVKAYNDLLQEHQALVERAQALLRASCVPVAGEWYVFRGPYLNIELARVESIDGSIIRFDNQGGCTRDWWDKHIVEPLVGSRWRWHGPAGLVRTVVDTDKHIAWSKVDPRGAGSVSVSALRLPHLAEYVVS